ncbi:MAG: hypothetical protein L0338_39015 [Acidobacteria bacterium]|nr:hypothetical protein [Acidobacteriota bacterium]
MAKVKSRRPAKKSSKKEPRTRLMPASAVLERWILAPAEKRLRAIFRKETGQEWEGGIGYRTPGFPERTAGSGVRVLSRIPSQVAMSAHNCLGWIGSLRKLLARCGEREARIALTGFRIGRDLMRAEMLRYFRSGARFALRAHLEQEKQADLKVKRVLAFQDARDKNPNRSDTAIARSASEKLYGKKNAYRTILNTVTEFDAETSGPSLRRSKRRK